MSLFLIFVCFICAGLYLMTTENPKLEDLGELGFLFILAGCVGVLVVLIEV